MPICELCGREMATAQGCAAHKILPGDGYLPLNPVPYGDEREGWRKIRIAPPLRCHDCGARAGQLHHPGCDVERCPVCSMSGRPGAEVASYHRREAAQAMMCKHCENRVLEGGEPK